MNISSFYIIFPCIVGIFMELLYISRLVVQNQLVKAKDKLLLNVFISNVITNIGLVFMSLTSDHCYLPQATIIAGFNSTVLFSVYYLYYEYLYLKSCNQALSKRKPISIYITIVIHLVSIGLGLASIFQIGGQNMDQTGTCFELVNSSFINQQYVLIICHLVPLLIGIILMSMQLYNIAVHLQRKYFIQVCTRKVILPTFCLLFYFIMGLQVTLQLCYPQDIKNPNKEQNPNAYRTEMWRQFGLYALSSYGILYSIFQIIFNRKKSLPVKKFQSFSSTHDDKSNLENLESSKEKSVLQKRFLSDDVELPAENLKLAISTKQINS